MDGKILAKDLIKGADGRHYTFDLSELKNAQNREFIGCEVDFETQDGKAVSIYVLWKNADERTNSPLQNENVSWQEIKLKAYIAIACVLFATLILAENPPIQKGFFGFCLYGCAFLLALSIVLALKKIAQSVNLLRNFLLSVGLSVLAIVVLFAPIYEISMFILLIIIAIIGIYFKYLFFKEFSYITNEPLFLCWFIIDTLLGFVAGGGFIGSSGMVLCLRVVDILLLVVPVARVKELRKSNNTKF